MDHPDLSGPARELIENPDNRVFLSAASCWEMAIKSALGRLEIPGKMEPFIAEQISLNHFTGLPVSVTHACAVHDLPPHHKDPFDRMLIAQTKVEKLVLVTGDPLIAKYDIPIVW